MPLDLAAIRARLDAATPGPWHLSADRETITQTSHVTRDVWTIPRTHEDMAFIAHAPADLAALLAEADRLAAALAEVQGELTDANAELLRTAEVLYGESHDARMLHNAAADAVAERDELRSANDALRADLREVIGACVVPSTEQIACADDVAEYVRACMGRVVAERDELAAVIANERGDGQPPGEGWEPHLHNGRWRWSRETGPAEYLIVRDGGDSGGWIYRHRLANGCVIGIDGISTAREAMRQADLAAGGGK